MEEKLLLKLNANKTITEDGHWIFTGYIGQNGYGELFIVGSKKRVHRLSYEVYNNIKLQEKDQVLHKPPCNNRRCFNPTHLYVGDYADNAQDKAILKTHCINGHPYDKNNLRFTGNNK